jgi:hypothetical protein
VACCYKKRNYITRKYNKEVRKLISPVCILNLEGILLNCSEGSCFGEVFPKAFHGAQNRAQQ